MHVSIKSAEDFGPFLQRTVEQVHVPREGDFGALFSIAYAKLPLMGPYFLTGRCVFEHVRAPSRRHEYPDLILDEWWAPTTEAMESVVRLLGSKATLNGIEMPEFYPPSVQRRIGDKSSMTAWPEWLIELRANRQANYGVTSDPVVRPGYRPYSSGNQAILDWVWRAPTKESSRRLYENQLLVVVPDFRSRITSAEWRGRTVTVELGGPEGGRELQILALVDGTHQSLSPVVGAGAGNVPVTFEVPAGTERVELFLVRPNCELADHVVLFSAGEEFAATVGDPTPEERAVQDLRTGENETVEFKEFIAPGESKEEQIVRTIVAFANTDGGRLYLGVKDGGTPEGGTALRKAGQGDVAAGWQALADRVRYLVREQVKPVPEIAVLQVRVFGEPILVVEVPACAGGPYSTHGNDVFIRKGATSRKPDPRTEFPQIGANARNAVLASEMFRT